MANSKKDKNTPKPADTPEGREKQLSNLAYALAEKQLRDGTASSATIGHFLKMDSSRERMEQEIMAKQKILIEAKSNIIIKDKETASLVQEALDAFKSYGKTE